jgi:glycosyltransferase involved in cell wall biosynthesis
MPPETPTTTLVICTTGAPSRLADIARRLSAALDASPGLEALVIDNSAAGGLAFDDPRIRVERSELPGLSRARTVADRQARGDAIVFTDDDVDFDPAWATRMARPLLAGEFDAVAAPVRLGAEFDHLTSPVVRGWLAEANLRGPVHLVGAGMAIHRRMLRIALWDERIGAGRPDFPFGEETLFEAMIRERGARIGLVADAGVVHHPDPSRTTDDQLRRVARQKGMSSAYFDYHWLGGSLRFPWLAGLRRELRLRWHRTRRGRRLDDHELDLTAWVGSARGYRVLRGEERAYIPRSRIPV